MCKIINIIIILLTIFFAAQNIYAGGSNYSRSLRSLARMYMATGYFDKAKPLAELALRSAKDNNAAQEEIAFCLLDLAYISNEQGDFLQALDLSRQALDIQKKVLAVGHPHIAYTLRTMSSIYLNQQNLEMAHTTLTDAISLMRKYHSPDDQQLTQFYIDMGKILTAQFKFDDADFYFTSALKTINVVYGGEHLYSALADSEVAKLRLLENKLDLAEKLITSSISIQKKIYGESNPAIIPSQLTLAKIYFAKSDFTHAKEIAVKCINTLKQTGGSSHQLMDEFNQIILSTNMLAKK